jgi:hypothetical protein
MHRIKLSVFFLTSISFFSFGDSNYPKIQKPLLVELANPVFDLENRFVPDAMSSIDSVVSLLKKLDFKSVNVYVFPKEKIKSFSLGLDLIYAKEVAEFLRHKVDRKSILAKYPYPYGKDQYFENDSARMMLVLEIFTE